MATYAVNQAAAKTLGAWCDFSMPIPFQFMEMHLVLCSEFALTPKMTARRNFSWDSTQ
jgi:hypothetical protein